MAFSAGLTLADLSDYLAPSQVCIKPEVFETKDNVGEYQVGVIDEKEIKRENETRAQISLSDCLACSGCVTSAEAVLVNMQSKEELAQMMQNRRPDQRFVMSIAPQSLANIAAAYRISSRDALLAIRQKMKAFGFDMVFDTSFAHEWSLLRARDDIRHHIASTSNQPILSSACPGWICYAEKTHGDMLPMISQVKSSLALMGSLVKYGPVAESLGTQPSSIIHVGIMMCFDKKLEASRADFQNDNVKDVDIVLTTTELLSILESNPPSDATPSMGSTSASSLVSSLPDQGLRPPEDLVMPSLLQPTGSSSGGFAFNALCAVLEDMPLEQVQNVSLEFKKVRSLDHVEYTLVKDGEILFRAAKCNGFRNLQNIVRKVAKDQGLSKAGARARIGSRASAPLDYVEIMACPSGCLNGGGQIPAKDLSTTADELLGRVEKEYFSTQDAKLDTDLSITVPVLDIPLFAHFSQAKALPGALGITDASVPASRWLQLQDDSIFKTQYHAVSEESGVDAVNVNW